MKLAVLSDIHGNADALKGVLHEIDELNIQNIIICGDFVGYYYQTKEVLKLLENRNIMACRGNHEDLFYAWCTGPADARAHLTKKYGSGFQIADSKLSAHEKNFLFSLEHPVFKQFEDRMLCIAHGAPWDINQYTYLDEEPLIQKQYQPTLKKCDMLFLGHTHYQGIQYVKGTWFVNPGSVGQPRSGLLSEGVKSTILRAQWAIVETSDLTVLFKTTLYDGAELFDSIKNFDPDISYLQNVLLRCDP